MSNKVDPGQMPRFVVSDLSLHCLLMFLNRIIRAHTEMHYM